MTIYFIEQNALSTAIKHRVAKCEEEAVPLLLSLLDDFHISYDLDEITKIRHEVWLHRKAIRHYKRARKRGLTEHFTAQELGHLIDQYGGCCHCDTDQPITIDHVIPMSQPGGSNRIDNIQPLCETCHREKERIYLTTGVLMDYRKVLS